MDENTATTIGAFLAISASIFNAIGYTVQKKGHTRLKEHNKGKKDGEKKRLIKEKVWAMGFGIYLIGGMLNAVSLFYAPQSLVLPLSAITLVANTMLATKVLGEPFFKADIAGIFFVILGSVLAVIFGPRTAGGDTTMEQLADRWADGSYMVFFVILSSVIGTDYVIVRFYERRNAKDESVTDELQHGTSFLLVSYCLLAGYFGSLAFLFLKSFTEFIGSSARSAQAASKNAGQWYSYFTLLGVVLTNFALEFFRQRGLSYFHAVYVVPINQVVLIVMGTVLGGLYFQEFDNMSSTDAGLFIVAILMTVIGVFILAFNSGNVSEKTEAIINHTITFSLDPNPDVHPLPIPKIITTSPSMPITRPLRTNIPDLPPPGIAGTIARIHGLQRSMATLQSTADGKPFYLDDNFDTFHMDKLGFDKVMEKLPIDPATLSKLNVLDHIDKRLGQNGKLRRGFSHNDVKDSSKLPSLNHKSSASVDKLRRLQESINGRPNGAELVSSQSERSTFDDYNRRRAPSTSHTGAQAEFIGVRPAPSPSYPPSTPNPNGNSNEMSTISEHVNGMNGDHRSSRTLENGSNHAMEIEMTMDDMDPTDAIHLAMDRSSSERTPNALKDQNTVSNDDTEEVQLQMEETVIKLSQQKTI